MGALHSLALLGVKHQSCAQEDKLVSPACAATTTMCADGSRDARAPTAELRYPSRLNNVTRNCSAGSARLSNARDETMPNKTATRPTERRSAAPPEEPKPHRSAGHAPASARSIWRGAI